MARPADAERGVVVTDEERDLLDAATFGRCHCGRPRRQHEKTVAADGSTTDLGADGSTTYLWVACDAGHELDLR